MSNVNVHTSVDVEIELNKEERNVLIEACKILCKLTKDLWDNDAEETEVYDRAYETKESLRVFLRCDVGENVDNNGEVINVQ